MPLIPDHVRYWDQYSSRKAASAPNEEAALRHAFGWTQYEDHGPGVELLGAPLCTLELGSGSGHAVAALALNGIRATGIDLSRTQCETARERWGKIADAHYEHGDVTEYLAAVEHRWEAIYSIWGALWFTDPEELLPLVRDRLTSGGRLVFSHAPPVPGSYGIQGMYGDGFTGRQVWIYRWAYEPATWADLLKHHGFTDVHARVLPAPLADHVGTLIVEARTRP